MTRKNPTKQPKLKQVVRTLDSKELAKVIGGAEPVDPGNDTSYRGLRNPGDGGRD
jgi:bacteriocin-like protein